MRLVLGLLVMLATLCPIGASAARLALVIGIDAYDTLPPLDKAVGDAEAMSARLEALGFTVTKVINPGRRDFNQAITAFRRALQPGDAAFVHYSGHGVEVEGRNLLLPRDIPIPTSGDEDFLMEEAIDLNELMLRVADSGAAVRIFVVDACRNNPFARKGVRGLGEAGGLAISPPPTGSFVLYSAGFRQTALDRLGPEDASPTSVYTRVLLERLSLPGASISEIARSVRVDVAALALSVGHEQSPAYYDELNQDFVVNSEAPAGAAPGADTSIEAAAFDRARDLGTAAAWEAFLKNYSEGVFADLARAALTDVTPTEAVAPPPSKTETMVSAFEARQKLDTLWREGRRLANAGDDAGFFRATSEARDLASLQFGTDSMEFAQANNHMVGALSGIGEMEEAITASRTAIDIYTRLVGAGDLRVLIEKANLAARLNATGKRDEARPIFEEILVAYEKLKLTGPNNVYYAHALEGYSRLLAGSGELERATRYAESAVALLDGSGASPSVDDAGIIMNYAWMLLDANRCKDAMPVVGKAKERMEAAGVATTQGDHAVILELIAKGCR
jgi:tetratricopeptide (TPR) repeat protein